MVTQTGSTGSEDGQSWKWTSGDTAHGNEAPADAGADAGVGMGHGGMHSRR
jgi:hypothetical protein